MSDKRYGVYAITNNINLKMYIGKGELSVRGTCRRWTHHMRKSSRSVIALAIKKHGADNFTFGWLETDRSEYAALILEQKWIAFWKTTDPEFGYNKTWGGDGIRRVSAVSDETRKKLSDAWIGRPSTPSPKKGKPGCPLSDEHKAKLLAANLGSTRSEASRQKMRLARRQRYNRR